MEVLEVGEIEREYMLVQARLQLLQKIADPTQFTGIHTISSKTFSVTCYVRIL